MKTNKNWYKDNKNLATKVIFNQFWFGIWIFALIIGTRHVEIVGDWKGYFLAIISVVMLLFQQSWEWEMIDYFKNKSKELSKK